MYADERMFEVGDLVIVDSLDKNGIIITIPPDFYDNVENKNEMKIRLRHTSDNGWISGPFCEVVIENAKRLVSIDDLILLRKAIKDE